MTKAPVIPNSITNMTDTFNGCTSLTGNIVININPKVYDNCFANTSELIVLLGVSTELGELASTATNGNVSVGLYTASGGAVYTDKDSLPSIKVGDTYAFGDYTYKYTSAGWVVNPVSDKTKSSYGTILSEINGKPVTSMYRTFKGCTKLVNAPTIHSSVTNMQETFYGCSKLVVSPVIPNSVTNMQETFRDCTALTDAPVIPDSVTNMYHTFDGCTSLINAPVILDGVTNMQGIFSGCTALKYASAIPDSVTNMQSAFYRCKALISAPNIPSRVTNMYQTFYGCTALTGDVVINANPTTYTNCFYNTTQPITLSGSSTKLSELAATSTKGNVSLKQP